MESITLASDKEKMVASFMEIAAGQSADTARSFLQATSWKLEESLQLYFVGNEVGVVASTSQSPPIKDSSVLPENDSGDPWNDDDGYADKNEVRAPLPVIREALYEYDALPRISRTGSLPYEGSSLLAFRNFEEETKRPEVWENDQGSTSSSDNSRDNLASLYRPPFSLMFCGSFEKAKTSASLDDKWLIVNLQSTIVFNSHMLNRDTWANETVSETIGTNFIFCQVYEDTSDGKKVRTYYRLDAVPAILVVDPITGQKMRSWFGMVQPQRLLEDLLPFMDNGPRNHHVSLSHKRPREISHTPSQQIKGRSVGEHDNSIDYEDAEMRLAIAASMENMGKNEGDNVESQETCLTQMPSFPPLPEEPKGNKSTLCRVALRLPDGRRIQRNFYRTDPIQLLWSFCESEMGSERGGRGFRLTHAIPNASTTLDYESALSFQQAGIANSIISVAWE